MTTASTFLVLFLKKNKVKTTTRTGEQTLSVTETSKRMLTKFVSIGSYSPEVRTFGTLITSTTVFSLIIYKKLSTTPPPQTILYLEI